MLYMIEINPACNSCAEDCCKINRLSNEHPTQYQICVAVMSQAEWKSNNGAKYSRRQLPLQLCWAMTVHKSQESTLVKCMYDLWKFEKEAGMTFVALSRFRRMGDFRVKHWTKERVRKIQCLLE